MRRYGFNKLIRERIFDYMLAQGGELVTRTLDSEAYRRELLAKLEAEFSEIDPTQPTEALSKLGDAQEIHDCLRTGTNEPPGNLVVIQARIDSAAAGLGFGRADVKATQSKRFALDGSFDHRTFVITVSLPDESRMIEHFQRHPDKYPEIP